MWQLISAGGRAIATYTGTMMLAFVAQSVVALICLFGVAQVLASAFAARPMFDDGVRGDLISLLFAFEHGQSAVLASLWLVIGVLFLWMAMSWFLTAGINGVLITKPQGRAETAKAFGTGVATTFLPYVILTVLCVPLLMLVLMVFSICVGSAVPMMETALTMPQLTGPLLLAFGPTVLLLAVLWTVVDIARADLARYRESHDLGALRALVRALLAVIRKPQAVAFSLFGWLMWSAIAIAYTLMVHGHPMLGAQGAFALFAIRSCVSLGRFAVKFALLGGAAEYSLALEPPPRASVDPD